MDDYHNNIRGCPARIHVKGNKVWRGRASMINSMVWDWQALGAIATALGTLVALGFGVYNAWHSRKTMARHENDRAFEIALRLVDVVGDYYKQAPDPIPASLTAVKGRYLIQILAIYGFDCNDSKVFNPTVDVSFAELNHLMEQIKEQQ